MAYEIIHLYDVDGGFGNAITKERTLGILETEEEAKEYVKRYSRDEIYSKPYAYMHCHNLTYRKLSTLDMDVDPFKNDGFTKEVIEFNNRCIHVINIIWDKNDIDYDEDLKVELFVPVEDEDEIGEFLEDYYCKAISWTVKGR